MNHESTTQSVVFPALLSNPVVAKLDEEYSSSDGGALLLKAIDERLGLSKALAGCLRDSRQAGKVAHEKIDLMRQRIFAIALGYPDGNEVRELSGDPLHKLAVVRDPVHGGSLASQPTLSLRERCRSVSHGQCPDRCRDRATSPSSGRRYKRITLDFLDDNGVEYVVGLFATRPLKKRSRRTLGTARRLFRETGETVPVYGETLHRTKITWPHKRRVIFKAEVVQLPAREPKDNLRFVVTNLRSSPQHVYGICTDRGDAENRIKKLRNDLAMDRTRVARGSWRTSFGFC